jgi:signal transduction histidine kinase
MGEAALKLGLVGSPLLNETAQPLLSLIDVIPHSCALIDGSGIILAVNPIWRQFGKENGLRNEGFCVGQNYLATCMKSSKIDALAQNALEGITRVLQFGDTFSMEYPCHSPNEKRWFMLTASPLRAAGNAKALLMHTNITERVIAEHATQTRYEELKALVEQRQAYERKLDEFYSMISHDIRSPMASVQASVRIVRSHESKVLSEVDHALLETAEMASNQVLSLITDYLDHKKIRARKQTFSMRSTPAKELVQKATSLLFGLAQSAEVTIETQADDCEIVCDGDSIARVLVNLLSNAIKFTPAGRSVRLIVEASRGKVKFIVRDQGIGMTSEVITKLFEPFATSAQSSFMSGSGLGMMIVKQILEEHGSAPFVESEIGVGTQISFLLDAASSSQSTT